MAIVRLEQDQIEVQKEFLHCLIGISGLPGEASGGRDMIVSSFNDYANMILRSRNTQEDEKERLMKILAEETNRVIELVPTYADVRKR